MIDVAILSLYFSAASLIGGLVALRSVHKHGSTARAALSAAASGAVALILGLLVSGLVSKVG